MVNITCHNLNHFVPSWREGDYRFPWKACNYCGSMHQEFLLEALENGAKLDHTDWKYGWPHKFYVKIVNPNPDHLFEIETRYRDPNDDSFKKIEENKWAKFGKLGFLYGKFYNEHLLDEGTPTELFTALEKHTGIKFSIKEGVLHYSTRSFQSNV